MTMTLAVDGEHIWFHHRSTNFIVNVFLPLADTALSAKVRASMIWIGYTLIYFCIFLFA